jgi:hypothetical protein
VAAGRAVKALDTNSLAVDRWSRAYLASASRSRRLRVWSSR